MKYRVFLFRVTFPGTPPHVVEVELAAFGETDDEARTHIEERLIGLAIPVGTRLELLQKSYELNETESDFLARWRNLTTTLDPALRDLVA